MDNRAAAETKYKKSVNNLLLVVIFSTVNIVMALLDASFYFPFSATFPMALLGVGAAMAAGSGAGLFYIIGIMAALFAVAVYLICYIFSRRHRGWIIAALVLFSLDTVFMLWLLAFSFEPSMLIDVAFHAWVLICLVNALRARIEFDKLPAAAPETATDNESYPVPEQTPAVRPQSAKGKVLLKQNFNDLEIIVKRAFGVTELIVNGMVYAEQKGLVEPNYTLESRFGSADIKFVNEVGAVGIIKLYVNGNLLAEKKRLV